jgi:outer membrane murein-binding lipoprotein Lpp
MISKSNQKRAEMLEEITTLRLLAQRVVSILDCLEVDCVLSACFNQIQDDVNELDSVVKKLNKKIKPLKKNTDGFCEELYGAREED